jgi:hypothetical protein
MDTKAGEWEMGKGSPSLAKTVPRRVRRGYQRRVLKQPCACGESRVGEEFRKAVKADAST